MPWTPTKAIIKPRALAQNVISYIQTNQADAILWANSNTALRSIKKFGDTVANRLLPVYPSMYMTDDNSASDYTNDVLTGAYSVQFEVNVQSTTPDEAKRQADVYAAAIESMLNNQPNSSRVTNTGALIAQLQLVEIGFLEIKANETQNDFLQTFQVRATYSLLVS